MARLARAVSKHSLAPLEVDYIAGASRSMGRHP